MSVIKGTVTSFISSLSATPPADAAATPAGPPVSGAIADAAAVGGAAGGSITFALDRTQRRMVAGLRQAFRRADANGDGILDRQEVESLLRNHLEGQNLNAAEREAEVAQFIG